MPIKFEKSYEYVWTKDTTSFANTYVDSLKIENPNQALGSSTLKIAPVANTHSIPLQQYGWQVAAIVVVAMCIYCRILYRFATQIRLVFKNTASISANLAAIDNPSKDLNKLLNISKFIVLFDVALIAMSAIGGVVTNTKQHNLLIFLGAIVLGTIVNIIRKAIRKSAGKITQTPGWFFYVDQIEKFNFAIFAIVFTPITLAMATYKPIFDIAIYGVGIMYILHILRIYILIQGKKFSFMQWFLYLCAVEIMPLCVIVASLVIINTTVLR